MTCASALPQQVAEWIDEIAEHAKAAEAIAALDSRQATIAIRNYLQRGPQVIPQPRCFAIAMLARWDTAETTTALREVLHSHPLRSLAPQLAESEYVVKCDAMDALAERNYEEFADDVAFGIGERLRAAVRAAGRHRVGGTAVMLGSLLDDDVLADAAAEALASMGEPAMAALIYRIDNWLWQSPYSARLRLALVRGLLVIAKLSKTVLVGESASIMQRALRDPHSLVRAAAALVLWSGPDCHELLDALIHGALGHDRSVARACADALTPVGTVLVAPALRALQRNAELDIYDEEKAPPEAQRRWLVMRVIEAASTSSTVMRSLYQCPPSLLADAVAHSPPPSMDALGTLLEHGAAEVRVAVVATLMHTHEEGAAGMLIGLLSDRDSSVRRSAFAALRAFPLGAFASMPRDRLPLRPLSRGFLLRLRLRRRMCGLSPREQR